MSNNSDAVIIICTRFQSARLPNKVFRLLAGVPAIEHILNRLSPLEIPVILAVPPDQEPVYRRFLREGVSIFQGNADSPLHRMAEAVSSVQPFPQFVIRVTHDDILIDAQTVKSLLDECRIKHAGYGYSPTIIEGAGVEVISTVNLLAAAQIRKDPTEFVSYFVRGSGLPNAEIVTHKPRASIQRPYRLTMDYENDAVLLECVLRSLGPNASLDKIAEYLDAKPYLLNINKLPIISFYTCVRNMEESIRETMLSVLSCGETSMEYIVLDDCSTDKTLEIIGEFANDPRVRIITNEVNMGLAASSNIAINKARGSYVVRVDGDDQLIVAVFQKAMHKIMQTLAFGAAGIVYPSYHEVNEYGGINRSSVDPRENHHAGCAVMSKRLIDEVRFKDGIRHWDGLELYQRVQKMGRTVGYYNEPIWMYRKREKSMSHSNLEERASLKKEILG